MISPQKGRKADESKQLRDNIRLLSNAFRDWLEQAMGSEGMTVAQLRMLYAVKMDPNGSAAAIARHCQVTPQTLQAMLQRAEREKWLVRKPAANNARILTSTLTPRGSALLARAKRHVARFERRVWRDISVTEMQSINTAFAKALQRMETLQKAEPDTSIQDGKKRASQR